MNLTAQQINPISLRYGMYIPLLLMIASAVSGCLSYSKAKQDIADDLNEAMIALADENRELWTRQDTIAALRHMHQTNHKPLIYQASDLNFRNATLKDIAYYTLALVDRKNSAPEMRGDRIASDSIMLVPEHGSNRFAIQVRGFAECSTAAVLSVSDQTLPGVFLTLSVLSTAIMFVWRRKRLGQISTDAVPIATAILSLDGVKLTPMQRQLTQMLLDAPGRKVDKATLCAALWGNKSNAEESLYTLIRRTKKALAEANIEITCNRGDSYELHINN